MEVSHIILGVSDMARALSFYRDVVGLDVLSESTAFTFLDAGTIRLALTPHAAPGGEDSRTEIVLAADDVADAFRELSGRGAAFEVSLRAVMSQDGAELHAAHFRDPDGHLVSITGWVTPD